MNDAQCVCVYKYIHFMSLNNLSQMRKGDEKAKFYENHWVYAVKIKRKLSNGPPFGSFSKENKNHSYLAQTISTSR